MSTVSDLSIPLQPPPLYRSYNFMPCNGSNDEEKIVNISALLKSQFYEKLSSDEIKSAIKVIKVVDDSKKTSYQTIFSFLGPNNQFHSFYSSDNN